MQSLSFAEFASALSDYRHTTCVVAFSGGIDSTVLLHLCHRLQQQGELTQLSAVHIHHGLSQYANAWVVHCEQLCKQWYIPLTVHHVTLRDSSDGIEQAARQARYEVFEAVLQHGGVLLQGHHQDDQAETILLRLFRGTGMAGIQGMPQQRSLSNGTIFRPLLNNRRANIEVYAQQHQLSYIEDDSNTDTQFARNFIRQELMPMIESRWQGATQRIVEFSADAAECYQRQLLRIEQVYQQCIAVKAEWTLRQDQPLLIIAALQQHDALNQQQIVRHWLQQQGCLAPSRLQLAQIFISVIEAKVNSEPLFRLNATTELRRFQGYLCLVPVIENQRTHNPLLDLQQLPLLLGHVSNTPDSLMLNYVVSDAHKQRIRLPNSTTTIKYRDQIAAEAKFATAGRCGRKTLKRWLQEYQVPPWWRDKLPLLFDGEVMVAAPNFWVCDGYQCDAGQAGYVFQLQWG